ncbi:hypothetical protein GCM10011402_11230 [Paracoccus acridae]|uniref:Uncharacterized protein n=1 Tax=Paracoccus acridae TaxID=1795310 RepID=A0ABQ1VH21_9RHOB|nr:DUF6152 family protein [Paracoccus acridae]GGF61042.1 hypothetical protein GCM10011402_11230 [Paracoccus acridae]
MFSILRPALLALAVLAPVAPPALAHHGWSWAEAEQSRLEGVIEDISMAPPHPSLRVRAADGTVWFVELGNPGRTTRSGFGPDTAAVGDAVTVIGNRDRDRAEAHIKAVRIVIDGRNYDMYPERIRPD